MLTQEHLKELLNYNPDTGIFTYKISRCGYRGIKIGDTAGSVSTDNYRRIGIAGKKYLAHRLAWFYMYGVWPDFQIDHRDHDRSNNRINNLRDVTQSGNMQNQVKATKQNLSCGFLGVRFHDKKGKYEAQIRINGKQKHLGSFPTAQEAHSAYLLAKRLHHSTCMI